MALQVLKKPVELHPRENKIKNFSVTWTKCKRPLIKTFKIMFSHTGANIQVLKVIIYQTVTAITDFNLGW